MDIMCFQFILVTSLNIESTFFFSSSVAILARIFEGSVVKEENFVTHELCMHTQFLIRLMPGPSQGLVKGTRCGGKTQLGGLASDPALSNTLSV